MYVHPIRSDDASLAPIALHPVEPKVAVLLNANAKRVNEKVRRTLSHVVPEGDLFLTRTFEEARAVAETVVERRYQTVFTGGGDGTFCGFLNEIYNVIERKRSANPFAVVRPPRFGVLKLGTGNSLANLCGASGSLGDGILDDVLRARANEIPGVVKLELLLSEGKRAPFVGLGLDAGVLNHFVEIKHGVAKSPFAKLLAGGAGYALAIAGRSIPSYMTSQRPHLEIKSRAIAYRLGHDGRPVGPAYGPGAILYSGPALIAAAATVPCYGFNFKLFPFAGQRRGMMHLRVANLSIPKIVPNIYPGLWQGKWFPEGLHDFFAEDVEIRMDRKVPFQVGGDAEGYRDAVRISMWRNSVELLDFNSAQRV
jgi:diacylglycerol kinase family enzyme